LPGKRWKKLLDLLARSENGKTATTVDVLMEYGYLKRGEFSASDLSDMGEDPMKMRLVKTASNRLTNAIADLGRELRQQVQGPPAKGKTLAVLSIASKKEVQAAFVVRHLVRGHDGKLRFGETRG
jgi:hypothetical protein